MYPLKIIEWLAYHYHTLPLRRVIAMRGGVSSVGRAVIFMVKGCGFRSHPLPLFKPGHAWTTGSVNIRFVCSTCMLPPTRFLKIYSVPLHVPGGCAQHSWDKWRGKVVFTIREVGFPPSRTEKQSIVIHLRADVMKLMLSNNIVINISKDLKFKFELMLLLQTWRFKYLRVKIAYCHVFKKQVV